MTSLPINGAARVGDLHQCGVSHVGGPLLPPCSETVKIDGVPCARAGDLLSCAGPGSAPDFVVTGSSTVFIDGRPAARLLDKTMHGAGMILAGSADVAIGGPAIGIMLGNARKAYGRFSAMASGRHSGKLQQSYGNCGIEAARQLINQATNNTVGEDALLNEAVAHGEAANSSDQTKLGGSRATSRQALMARHFVPSSLQPNTLASIEQAVAERKGVISTHEVSVLWGPSQTGGHAVVVTGLAYNPDGTLQNVIINDTGTGQGARAVPAQQFEESLLYGDNANVTDAPIW